MGATPSDQYLAALAGSTRSYLGEVQQLCAGVGEESLAWRPEAGRWSMAQCFEHLTVTAASYHPRIAAGIDDNPARDAGGIPFRRTWIGGKLVDSMRVSTGRRRLKAPRLFRPANEPAPGSAERLVKTISELEELLARAAGANLVRGRVRSPALPLLRLNLGEALELQVVHIARHLAQARRVREHDDFPSSIARPE